MKNQHEQPSRPVHRWGGWYQVHNIETLSESEADWIRSTRNCLVSVTAGLVCFSFVDSREFRSAISCPYFHKIHSLCPSSLCCPLLWLFILVAIIYFSIFYDPQFFNLSLHTQHKNSDSQMLQKGTCWTHLRRWKEKKIFLCDVQAIHVWIINDVSVWGLLRPGDHFKSI